MTPVSSDQCVLIRLCAELGRAALGGIKNYEAIVSRDGQGLPAIIFLLLLLGFKRSLLRLHTQCSPSTCAPFFASENNSFARLSLLHIGTFFFLKKWTRT
ncbi:hypothetical protein CDAR_527681 [Caerostris darwini]|uniref:Uncharacterized protein n=1 Tax=Caerostris darwini TaxID=1538125 RepID=A0AAV4R9Z7_9ARAC|nr:hypothetical protein CDAR_527681 [Caerostris darwini]